LAAETCNSVAHYFTSDVHLRFDQSDRGRRFRAFLSQLHLGDVLVIAGDLCDFWMAARSTERELLRCESLQALAEFRRQGGELLIMAGNHDAWLCPFYQRELGARIIGEPIDFSIHGVRLRLVHGHRLGARRAWKGWMETHAFFAAFRRIPGALAVLLDRVLSWNNNRSLDDDEQRHLVLYRQYAALWRDQADLVVVGHLHRPVDEINGGVRLIVLGGWQGRSSYLRLDASGANFHIDGDSSPHPESAVPALLLSATEEAGPHEN
jgi:UDP-2,3-diacylglucosamine hydrolase